MPEEPRIQYFGEKWDAPMTDDADPIPTPTDESCVWCQHQFEEGDQGLRHIYGHYEHKECGLRNVMGGIGHLVDHARYCRSELGPDAGLDRRVSAKLVWEWYVNGTRYTAEELDLMRAAQS